MFAMSTIFVNASASISLQDLDGVKKILSMQAAQSEKIEGNTDVVDEEVQEENRDDNLQPGQVSIHSATGPEVEEELQIDRTAAQTCFSCEVASNNHNQVTGASARTA